MGRKSTIKTEFLDNSIPEPNSGCYLWERGIQKDGYGVVIYNKKYQLAHRISYEIYVGPIPTGLKVCHKCDNPPCINPDHLFLGTQKQNMEDCARKKRFGERRGEKSNRRVLTAKQVLEISNHLKVCHS